MITKHSDDIVDQLMVAYEFDRCDVCKDAADEIERLRGLVDACAIYLKEDETPVQRIERERADTEAVLKLLLKEKREVERLRSLLREWLDGSEEGADTYEKRVREALGE